MKEGKFVKSVAVWECCNSST